MQSRIVELAASQEETYHVGRWGMPEFDMDAHDVLELLVLGNGRVDKPFESISNVEAWFDIRWL